MIRETEIVIKKYDNNVVFSEYEKGVLIFEFRESPDKFERISRIIRNVAYKWRNDIEVEECLNIGKDI